MGSSFSGESNYHPPLLKFSGVKFLSGKKMMDMDMWYTDVYIPLYEKYYNHEEILALIEFYETPVGRRIIEVQPQLAAESTLMGMEKGQQMAMEVMQKMQGTTQ